MKRRNPPSPQEVERRGDYRAARATAPTVRSWYQSGARHAYEEAAADTEQPPDTPR